MARRSRTEIEIKPEVTSKKRYSIVEVREQLRAVEGLLIQGATHGQIVRAMKKFAVPCGEKRATNLIERIKTQWAQEDDAVRAVKKAAAERRLIQHIENAKGDVADDGTYKNANFQAIGRFEQLLADLQGTREPVKVQLDLQVSVAVAQLVATYTPEQVTRAITEMAQLERDAELWRKSLPPSKTAG